MKTSTVSDPRPALLSQRLPVSQRVELSLVFMVAAAVGEVALTSRGMARAAELLIPLANSAMCCLLWVVPSLQPRRLLGLLIIFVAWAIVSLGISDQVAKLMLPVPVSQEVTGP